MPSAALAQLATAANSNSYAPSDPHAPRTNASSATSSTAALVAVSTPGAAQSDWRAGSALFDLKMNPFIVPGQSTIVPSDSGLPVEVKASAASLNPYRDGRIRTAVPSKLKGKTTKMQGNFSVMQIHVEKPQMTERDLAAKLTSERTAAAARLASTQGYRHPRRPRPPPSTVAPPPVPPPQPHLNPHLVIVDDSRPLVKPAPFVSAVSHEKPSDKQSAEKEAIQEIDTEHAADPFSETDNVHDINTRHTDSSLGAEVAHDDKSAHADDSFITDVDAMHDISMKRPNESITPADAARETNTEPTTNPKPSSRTLVPRVAPKDIKAEQTRLLELLQKLRPAAVVDRLCLALTQFGGVPDGPPPLDGRFPESASTNGSGDLFISWVSEVFPPAVIKSTTIKRPPKPPTGRPRGRPKGSTKRLLQAGTRIMNTTFIPLAITPEGTDSTQLSSVDKVSGAIQQSVTSDPGSETPLPNNQGLDTPPSRVANEQSSTTVAIPTAPRLMDIPAEARAGSNRPRAIAPIVPAGSVRPVPGALIAPMARHKKSTGKPRGRPKGSKNKPRSQLKEQSSSFRVPNALRDEPEPEPEPNPNTPTTEDQPSNSSKSTTISNLATEPRRALQPILPFPELPNTSEAAISIIQGATFGSPRSTHEKRAEPDAIDAIISQQSQSPKIHDQGNSQVSSRKRKGLRQGPQADARVIDTHQASSMDVPPVMSHTRVQQAKRRCVSPDSRSRDLAVSEVNAQSAGAEVAASTSIATAGRLLPSPGSFNTQTQTTIVEHNLHQRVQPVPSHPCQQHQGNQQGHLQRQPQQYPSPGLNSVHSNESSNIPSPVAVRGLPEAPGHIPLEVTVVDMYQRQQQQRQQRQMASQLSQSAGGSFARIIGSNSPVEIQGFGGQPPPSQQGQQAHLYSAGTPPLANMDHVETHPHSTAPAPVENMSQVHNVDGQDYIGMDYPINSGVGAQFERVSRLNPALTETDMCDRIDHTMGRE